MSLPTTRISYTPGVLWAVNGEFFMPSDKYYTRMTDMLYSSLLEPDYTVHLTRRLTSL